MRFGVLHLAVFFTIVTGCKTTSGSQAKAWEIGEAGSAHALIISTVVKYYPEAAAATATLDRFATALQDEKTDQTQSAAYVLQAYYDKSKTQTSAETSPFDLYVTQQFAVLTNYAEVASNPGIALVYSGKSK